ncbi:MAG: signal peptidase I [Erysipelotrichales bacterium]
MTKIREILQLILAFLLVALIFQLVFLSVNVKGKSMEPTYIEGERSIMVRKSKINKVDRYNVVVIKREIKETNTSRIVKRVFGMPNETIEIKNKKIYINGKEIEDKIDTSNIKMDDMAPVLLGDDEYFVLGDNRENSSDSRDPRIGVIKDREIEAVHGFIYWPINKVGTMK